MLLGFSVLVRDLKDVTRTNCDFLLENSRFGTPFVEEDVAENSLSESRFLLCSPILIGEMAIPQDFEAYGAAPPANGARSSLRPMRVTFVTGFMFLTMMAAIAFLVSDSKEEAGRIEDMVTIAPEAKLNELVTSFAVKGDSMSVAEMEEKLESWRNNPSTLLDFPEHERTQVAVFRFFFDGLIFSLRSFFVFFVQMLANFHTSSLVDDSTLCAKKDIIINKFNQLLKKLGGEVRYFLIILISGTFPSFRFFSN